MMTSISGELGTGKTYVLARRVYEESMRGCLCITNFKHVYANIVIQNDRDSLLELIRQIAVLKQSGGETCDILPAFRHTGVFIAIDEAHLVFGREVPKQDMEDVILPFVSLARKQDVHIWYTVQDPATIHKTFRRYTQDWIRVRPIIPLFKTVYTMHESRPTVRRERRLLIPYVWEETHHLDYENPVFNYRRRHLAEGGSEWHETSTIVGRKIRKNSDPFIHSLYDSNELSGVNVDPTKEETFSLLRNVYYIPATLQRDPIPSLRKVLSFFGLRTIAPHVPPRIQLSGWQMPKLNGSRKVPKLEQETKSLSVVDFLKNPDVKMSRLERRRILHIAKPLLLSSPPSHVGNDQSNTSEQAKNDQSGRMEKTRLRDVIQKVGGFLSPSGDRKRAKEATRRVRRNTRRDILPPDTGKPERKKARITLRQAAQRPA